MQNMISGVPFWTSINPIPAQYPYLTQDECCDVAVIGGGVTGALCAYRLAMMGVNTILVDAGITGYTSTSVSAAMVHYELECNLKQLRTIVGNDMAVRAYKACGEAVANIASIVEDLGVNCDFAVRDSFYYTGDTATENEIREEYLLRKHSGFDVQLFDKNNSSDLFSFNVAAGIYSVGLGGEIDPYKFAHALIAAAVAQGARVFENTHIDEVSNEVDCVHLYSNTHKKITCKKVVVATGNAQKGQLCDVSTTSKTSFAIVTEPVQSFAGWHNRCNIKDNCAPNTYLRTTADNRIIIGGLDSGAVDGDGKLAGIVKLPGYSEGKYTKLKAILQDMFPAISGLKTEYQFSGLSLDTGDSLPYIGEHQKYPNTYFALCWGSNGIPFSEIASRLICDLYHGQYPAELELFKFGR